jgi:hypothetical protein
MAITAAVCNSYKQEILQGVHEAADTYKIALYTSAATLSSATTAYTATSEVSNSGTNYTTGGATLSGFAVTLDGSTAILDFADATWANASFTARGALIYNSTQSNKAVAVLDFGSDITATAATFTVTMPAAAAATGLIRVA